MNWLDEEDADYVLDWLGFDGTNAVDPFGPAGAGMFVLDLEAGFKVTHKWPLDLHKFRSGKERRISRNDSARDHYDGNAVLLDNQPRAVLAQFARYATAGAMFLFGLPHEQLEVLSVSGATVTVSAGELALTDWAKPGQRVTGVYVDATDTLVSKDATIQDVTGAVITTDASFDAATYFLMPTRPVFFEPQQTFVRYPVTEEVWQVTAVAAIFDFAPTLASASVDDPTHFFAATGAIAFSRVFGAQGNALRLVFIQGGGYPAAGEMVESGTTTTIHINPLVTTLGNLATLLTSSANFRLGGTYNPATAIGWDLDITASGGSVAGDVGTGATLTTYSGDGTSRPVWDRPIEGDQATDAVQAMTKIIDHDALPDVISTADRADFGRMVSVQNGQRDIWQWLKLFLSTTKGGQKTFWFSSWRNDLTFLSKNTNVITITTDDLTAWWPYQRQHIEIEETTGTITRAKITAATDNGGGSWTLTIGTTIASSNVSRISWLDLCRFEGEEFEFMFDGKGVHFEAHARAVQQ